MSGPGDREVALERDLGGAGRVLFTTRADGNLSLAAGDDHEHGRQTRDDLCERLGLRWLCAGPQVHGSTVQRVREQRGELGAPVAFEADGHVTAQAGLGMMVLTADCLPVALAGEGVVGMVHAGWRGLACGVLEEGVSATRELGGGGELAAVIGPRAGLCCYEVGDEVHEALGSSHREGMRIDLGAIARDRLLAAGVSSIELLDICTICDQRFFSHRREGERAGRQAGIVWLR